MPPLKNDLHVFIDNGYYENLRGQVLKSTDQPRSYVVDIPDHGSIVHNCKFVKLCLENSADHFVAISTEPNSNAENNNGKTSKLLCYSFWPCLKTQNYMNA